MFTKEIYAVTAVLVLAAPLCVAQQPTQQGKAADGKPALATNVQKNCRSISADIRSGAPLTREIVVAEMVRARAEGEMDFHISSTPPAVYRPMCELPPQSAPQPASQKAKG